MRISNSYSNIYNRINNSLNTSPINFEARRKNLEQAQKPAKPSMSLQIGQKKAPELEKRSIMLQDEALNVLHVQTGDIEEKAEECYKKAVTELYHPNLEGYSSVREYMEDHSGFIHPSGITILTKPIAYDIKSKEKGLEVRLTSRDDNSVCSKEEFSLTHYGELISYKKIIEPAEKGRTQFREFTFDEDENLAIYREGAQKSKKEEGSDKKFYFRHGKIERIEVKPTTNSRTGAKDIKEVFEFHNGKLKYVYLDVNETKDGNTSFKSKYEADRDGKLTCIFNRLI